MIKLTLILTLLLMTSPVNATVKEMVNSPVKQKSETVATVVGSVVYVPVKIVLTVLRAPFKFFEGVAK